MHFFLSNKHTETHDPRMVVTHCGSLLAHIVEGWRKWLVCLILLISSSFPNQVKILPDRPNHLFQQIQEVKRLPGFHL